jgi:hypothetical protein
MMKSIRMLVASLALVLLLGPVAIAQEKANETAGNKEGIPAKVQVVFSEFDGEKKVSSLPYTLSLVASMDRGRNYSSLRMGLKVPILSGPKDQFGQVQMQYMDVGTNIDARVQPTPDGRFVLNMQIRRSSVHTLEGANKEAAWSMGEASGRPILRDYSAGFDFILRDAQTMQTTMATDPVSGRVLRVEVTLNVVK